MSNTVTEFAKLMLNIKMFSKFFVRLCFFIFAIQIIVICVFNSFFNSHWDETKQLMMQAFNATPNNALDGIFAKLNLACDLLYDTQKRIILKSLVVWFILPLILIYMALFDKNNANERQYIQGRKYVDPQDLNDEMFTKFGFLKFLFLNKMLPFGEVYLPVEEEIKQTFVVGKPGSGKTNLFNHVISKIRDRKQKLIIHDFKGDYVEKFYNEKTDLLFNPLDKRSLGWCLFNDCKSVMDIELFSSALIPEAPPGGDPFWNNAARDVMVGILHYCYANSLKTNQGIWQTCILPNDVLYDKLRCTKGGERGAKHIEDTSSKTAASIMSNLMQYVKVFEYMQDMKGDFSITEWAKNNNDKKTIFISNYPKLQHTLNPMISLFIQTVGSVLLSESDNLNNRLFFMLDEFGQLPSMFTIQSLMTASRSKGGAVFIGVQDIAQMDKIYKKESRTSILNSASNRVIFNCKDYDTAKFLSNDIGETEYYESQESQSLALSDSDRLTSSNQRRKEHLVTTEDIQSLKDLTAFVSIGHYDITLSHFKYKVIAKKSEAFMQREHLNLSQMKDVNFVIDAETGEIQNEETQSENNNIMV